MTIHVFDFDGVLACGRYDAIYKLPVEEGEAALLDWACGHYRLNRDPSVQYNRHAVVMAWINEQQMGTVPGPMLKKVKEAEAAGEPWFLLTARSVEDAIVLVGRYLDHNSLNPAEMFFVGRGGKTAQLTYLATSYPDQDVIFYDDSVSHIDAAKALPLSNLKPVLVSDGQNEDAGRILYEQIQFDLEQRRLND